MKLLTLEEIEKIEKLQRELGDLEPEPCELGVWQVEMSKFNYYRLPALLATARAYWEEKLVDIKDTNNNKLDDKPQTPICKNQFFKSEEDRIAKGVGCNCPNHKP